MAKRNRAKEAQHPRNVARVAALCLLAVVMLAVTACRQEPVPAPTQTATPVPTAAGDLVSWPPPMARGRLWQTMTLLPDARVLVTGGVGELESWDVLASAEVYDPSTQRWSNTASMGVGRFLHTATLLRDGRVLVVGVYDPAFPTAEVYDPATNTWSSTGELAQPRRAHTATVLSDGKVLVVGGLDSNYEFRSSAEIYDPTTGKWSPAGNMSIGRVWHTTTLLQDGRVLVVGGCSPPIEPGKEGHVLASAEVYDPSTNQWSVTGSMEHERYSHKATPLKDGRVLVTGGVPYRAGNPPSFTSAEAYAPSTGAWSPVSSMVTGRAAHTTTVLPDGRILVTGGWGGEDGLSMTSAEVYDQSSNTWSPVSAMARARQRHTEVLLPDGRVMVAGGTDKGDPLLSSVEVYDPSTDTWLSSDVAARALASPTPTSPGVPGGATTGEIVTITMTEAPYTFQPNSFNFEVGKAYVLDFVPPTMFHTFTVWGLDLNIFIMPGERKQVEFTPSKVGTFRLICTPHEAMGMIGEINVQ